MAKVARQKSASAAPSGARQPKKSAARLPETERAIRHRLTPRAALRGLDDAAEFLEEMGLLLQTPHPYLPSLFGAAQGKPAKPGVAGFGQWPAHAWSWAGELAEREDVLTTKVLLGKRTLVHRRLWKALDSAVRELQPLTPDAEAIVTALRARKSVRSDELPNLAGFEGTLAKKRYHRAMTQLEWSGMVICAPALVDQHKHVAIAALWSTRFPQPLAKPRGPADFIKATLEAAGPTPERELVKWCNWPKPGVQHAVSELVSKGELRLAEGLLIPT